MFPGGTPALWFSLCVKHDTTTTLMTQYGKALENAKVMNWLAACRECLVVVATSSPSAPSKMKVEMHLKWHARFRSVFRGWAGARAKG